MEWKLFSIYDSKARTWSPHLMPARATGQALRDFANLANDPGTTIGRWPSDFQIFEIGTFDDASGHIQLLHTPTPLGLAQEYVHDGHPQSLAPERDGRAGPVFNGSDGGDSSEPVQQEPDAQDHV